MIVNLQLLRNTEMLSTCDYFKTRKLFFLARSNLLKYEQSTDQNFIPRFFWTGQYYLWEFLFSKGAVSISHTLLHVKSRLSPFNSAQCTAGAPEHMGTKRNGPGSQPNFDGISIFSLQLFILTQKISLDFQWILDFVSTTF